jgi:hypothetical protein
VDEMTAGAGREMTTARSELGPLQEDYTRAFWSLSLAPDKIHPLIH